MKRALAIAATASCVLAASAARAETPACAIIANTAYLAAAGAATISSNPASTRVAELLDLRLSAGTDSVALAPGGLQAVPFLLANTGNGEEAFILEGQILGGDAVIEGFVFDRDGNGAFDPSADLVIPARGATPLAAAGGTFKLFALVRGGATPTTGVLSVTAHAVTGSGEPGNAFAGLGDGGCDAVAGGTGARGTATVTLTAAPGSDLGQVELFKSQSIVAINGGSEPSPGATVTYTIDSRFGGGGVVKSARLADLIPSGTVYIPGSIRLDGAVLTDAADGDAGEFDGAAIHVVLGDVPAPATRRVQFQVKIQ